jgi:hypothetical protein
MIRGSFDLGQSAILVDSEKSEQTRAMLKNRLLALSHQVPGQHLADFPTSLVDEGLDNDRR